MEDSMITTEVRQSIRSPPRRRRSTFFERRNSMGPPKPTENDSNLCEITTEINSKHIQDLRKYYDNLLAEKDQWKREVIDRKNRHSDLEQQRRMTCKTKHISRISFSTLSNEDIAFLNAKPNTSKLIDSQLKLHKSVKHAQAVFRQASEHENVILSYCESRVNEITEYILENSTIEPKQ